MNTVTLNRKHSQRVVLDIAPRKYNFFMELLGNFDFVQVSKEEENDGDSREEIIANLKQVAKDLKLLKAGKLETRPAEELLGQQDTISDHEIQKIIETEIEE